MSRANVARINDWLWVGNCESCPEFPGPSVVHIFRTDKEVEGKPSQERCCLHHGRRNLRMNYKDGDEFDESNLKNLDAFLWSLCRPQAPLYLEGVLVHCHAGMCRSPTVAIYALSVLENLHPLDAQRLVMKAIYEQRSGEVCNVCRDPLKQILKLWESRR